MAIVGEIAAIEANAQAREDALRRERIARAQQRAQIQLQTRATLAGITETLSDDRGVLRDQIKNALVRATAARKSGNLLLLDQIRQEIAGYRAALAGLKNNANELKIDAFRIFTEMRRTFEEFAPNIQTAGGQTGVLGRFGATATPTGPYGAAAPPRAQPNITINQSFPSPTENRFREITYAAWAVKANWDAEL